jgi:hypothetical protein
VTADDDSLCGGILNGKACAMRSIVSKHSNHLLALKGEKCVMPTWSEWNITAKAATPEVYPPGSKARGRAGGDLGVSQ